MDQPKIERMLRLMKYMSGSFNYTVEELADKLDMSYRTIYRYIDTFKNAGFAVTKTYGNVYKLEVIPRNAPNFNKLVYFSEEEAYIVNSLIDSLTSTNTLKKGLKEKLAVIYDSTSIEDFVDVHSNTAHVQALQEAAKKKKRVLLRQYESGNSSSIRDRFIEPFGFTTDFIDVWGYDIEDGHNKLFKIQRIGTVEVLEEDWENESSHRRQGIDAFHMSGRTAHNVKLQLSIRAKNLLVEEYPLAEKDITRKNKEWLLDTTVYDFAGICRFYMGLAHEIKIVDSPEFLQYVQEYTESFLNFKR